MADQAYGGFWIRVLAYLVDSVVVLSAVIVLAFVAALLGDIGKALIPLICLLTPLLYWGLMQASARQATFGKALLGMRVTDTSGNRISHLRSFGRELAKWVSGIPLGLGYVMVAFTGRKQALHDMVAATTVTRESSGHVLIALLVGVFGWIMPAALGMFIGGALIAVMMGTTGANLMGQMAQVDRKSVPVRTAAAPPAQPAPKPEVKPTVTAPPPVAPSAPTPASPVTAEKSGGEPTPKPAARPVEPKLAELPVPARVAELPVVRAPAIPGPRYNDLMTAVMVADPAGVQELLAFGKWPDKPDTNGNTPLLVAVVRGDRESAELLLKAGAYADRALAVSRQRGDPAMTALLERYSATSKRP